jgi:hypothetical protein
MTAAVKVFSHAGVVSVPIVGQALATSDQAFVALKQPYLGSDALSCDTSTADASETSAAPKGTTCVRVDVQTGKVVHYELTPQNATLRTATANSPTIEGRNTLQFGEGWRLSVLEQT